MKKVIPSLKLLSKHQIRNLTWAKFTSKFCENCIVNYSSPNFFQNCQNKLCRKEPMIKGILSTDLNLFDTLPSNRFKICQVQTSRFCQFCHNAELSESEMRNLNQLLDRHLKGKPVGLIGSQRSQRATNLKNCLMP